MAFVIAAEEDLPFGRKRQDLYLIRFAATDMPECKLLLHDVSRVLSARRGMNACALIAGS
jgi:hypothetical protein